jgi:hypothetical protein
MALAKSPLSQVCKGLRDHLNGALNAGGGSAVTVVIDSPAATAGINDIDTKHYLNLFFFRFEPAGLFPDTLPGETGWMRTFCLATPFAFKEDSVGSGEGDLKLIGEVLRIVHEAPVLRLTVDGEDYHVQVIFQPLALDQLNQLWSTQGDTTYRPSVLFEVSLAPVIPATPAVPAPLAGAFGLAVQAALPPRENTAAGRAPEVPALQPVIALDDWTPAICFVRDGTCSFSLSLSLGSVELDGDAAALPPVPAFVPQVWLAGRPGESVTLRWETWDAANGWRQHEPATVAAVADRSIDPASASGATLLAMPLPFRDHVGQMLLHAERSVTRRSDGAQLTLRSNPLLISLYAF